MIHFISTIYLEQPKTVVAAKHNIQIYCTEPFSVSSTDALSLCTSSLQIMWFIPIRWNSVKESYDLDIENNPPQNSGLTWKWW
jgi:hypothetical protein